MSDLLVCDLQFLTFLQIFCIYDVIRKVVRRYIHFYGSTVTNIYRILLVDRR